MATNLDKAILRAIAELHNVDANAPFDIQRYIRAFGASARSKADAVLSALDESPFAGLRPVFVSIGGGDGEELAHLLRNSRATTGVLIEAMRVLANEAMEKNSALPAGKKLEVFEGDAQGILRDAMTLAAGVISTGGADFIAVSCHAVIHELFDRGRETFDPLGFFAVIFADQDLSTWFTYREPGEPEKWPEIVLLGADCSPSSLLRLATAIRERHRSLADRDPSPTIVGSSLRVHRTLAIELLAKLFYLDDLIHEIQERSTSVNHTDMTNYLALAIGLGEPTSNNLPVLNTSSAATSSFKKLWEEYRVRATGLKPDGTQLRLAIPESHTRIIAWRPAPGFVPRPGPTLPDPTPSLAEGTGQSDLYLTSKAEQAGDSTLLTALLVSRGRYWIESPDKERALTVMRSVSERYPKESLASLWSIYLLSISELFAGQTDLGRATFSPEFESMAGRVGLGTLFKAERMEFARKTGASDEAVRIANQIRTRFSATTKSRTSRVNALLSRLSLSSRSSQDAPWADAFPDFKGYVEGTATYLLANLLRSGGRYDLALDIIVRATSSFRAGIPSHDTELVHCQYAVQVCTSMMGIAEFTSPDFSSGPSVPLFAMSLVHLASANAAWFLGDVERAGSLVARAAEEFGRVAAPNYVERAHLVQRLLQVWASYARGDNPDFTGIAEDSTYAIRAMKEPGVDPLPLRDWLARQRPSAAVGLLQFAKDGPRWSHPLSLTLPRTLSVTSRGEWRWDVNPTAQSLQEADRILREAMRIPLERRVPLIAD